ncbi:hypothetical protein Tco_0545383 [Tanacetum coccineum]
MLPKRNQPIFDAPLVFVGLYTHSFTHSNLRIPLPKFFYEVLNYFKVHISHFNPFGLAKLTTFVVMCKTYGDERIVKLLRAFLNLDRAANWLTLSNRGEANVPRAITKPFTHIKGWKEMDFKSFMMEGIDGKFHFLPTDDIRNEGGSSPSVSVNNETLVTYVKPLNVVVASQFSKNITDSDEAPSERDEVVLIDCSVAEKAKSRKVSAPLKVVDVETDPDIHEFFSAKELEDSTDCHWVVAHDLEKNPLILDLREKIKTLQGQVEKLHGVCVGAKVVPHVGMELVRSDEMGLLIARLVKTAIIHEATVDPYAPLEVLLSNKPKSLRAKSDPSHSQSKSKPSSSKTAPSPKAFLTTFGSSYVGPIFPWISALLALFSRMLVAVRLPSLDDFSQSSLYAFDDVPVCDLHLSICVRMVNEGEGLDFEYAYDVFPYELLHMLSCYGY